MDFEKAFTFLAKLSRNNNREWFEKQKPKFLDIKAEFELFVEELYDLALHFDHSLAGQEPRKLVFRIYRDVRFSKDKKPYKTFLSAGLSSAGKGTGKPGYYLQLEPHNKSFICAGLFAPPAELLSKIRQEIDYNSDVLGKIVNEKTFKKQFGKFWDGDSLKTAPKGFPKDHPNLEWLKLKSFVVMHKFSDAEVNNKKFLKHLAEIMKTGKPLNDFLSQAID
jgi:uncharacterized protein (TIGR02453 family)